VLSKDLNSYLNERLAGQGTRDKITGIRSIGGGSINRAYSFKFDHQNYFLKLNSAKKYPRMLELEVKGLSLLAQSNSLVFPKPLLQDTLGDEQFLVMELLERAPEDKDFFFGLGKGLAALHKNSSPQFGLDHSNYIGSLPQDNTLANTWSEFFIVSRIEPLLKKVIDSGDLPGNCMNHFNSLFKKLEAIIPPEKPALLHGDFWSGNKMNTTKGPAVFDPAVYYGHREADIAMTRLFRGFDRKFYTSYNEAFLLEKGWEGRADIFNLHPLLVHTILFGGGYAADVISIIRKF